MMKQWRCKACGKVFQDEGHGAPKEHGDFYVYRDGVTQDKCEGTLELLSDTCIDHKCMYCKSLMCGMEFPCNDCKHGESTNVNCHYELATP